MLDRIDIHIEVPGVDYEKLSDDRLGVPSEKIRERVEAARQIQRDRFDARATHESPQLVTCNADMRPAHIRQTCQLDETCKALDAAQTSFAFAMNQIHADL